MARKEEGLGVTFKIGPGQKLIKRGMDAKLEVSGGAPAFKPKPKPVAKVADTKPAPTPVESQSNMPRGPAPKPAVGDMGTKDAKSGYRKQPSAMDMATANAKPAAPVPSAQDRRVVGRGVGPYRDDGYNMYPRDPGMKNGGKVRGDGKCRCTTKGRMV
jgi:hypothetical protein